MDYRKDYFEIMNNLNDEIASLAFEFLGKTYPSVGLSDVKHKTAAEFVNILKISKTICVHKLFMSNGGLCEAKANLLMFV